MDFYKEKNQNELYEDFELINNFSDEEGYGDGAALATTWLRTITPLASFILS